MESLTSEQGARPKTSPAKGDNIGFATFLIDLKNVLLKEEVKMVATALDFKPAELDKVERSEDPCHVFVHALKRKGIISRTDISALTDKLKTCGLHGVADDANDLFKRYQSKLKFQPRKSNENNDKKSQFVRQLKNKYKYLCRGIQPVPFLRDKYDIENLFVECGIELLEEKHGTIKEQEKWIGIKDYKTAFTDPRTKSKRRIINADPGYGKSTLALQITNDWCQATPPMEEFEILIFLRLRQFRNVPTIYSAIKMFLLPKDTRLTEDDIETILDSSSTIILLDGYDEYPDRGKEDTDIKHILRGDMFQTHEVVLTTRTSCLPPDYSNATYIRLRLTGFDKNSRETFIRKVTGSGRSVKADIINMFLKENPVTADLCDVPLVFAMISYLVNNSERFRNVRTLTEVFRYIIKCFNSHNEIKFIEEKQKEELDHSGLDELAFEGLSGDVQQISWNRSKVRGKIGKGLYEEYVRIGILVEEEGFDYDSLEYYTETRFFHKLFAEWYAAHFLAKLAAKSVTEFETGIDFEIQKWPESQAAGNLQPHQAKNGGEVHSLKRINPHDVHYMYRFACGLSSVAAQKIIEHLGTNVHYDQYTLLCIKEWGGSLDAIEETVTLLCSRRIQIKDTDSLLLQKSVISLVDFASSRRIPIDWVHLDNCLDVRSSGDLHVKPSHFSLPVIHTLTMLGINEYGREMTKEETDSILQYSAKCLGLKYVQFEDCLLPHVIEITDSVSTLRSRDVAVLWDPVFGGALLNLQSGQWEKYGDGRTMSAEEYQEAVEDVRRIEEDDPESSNNSETDSECK